MANVLQPHIEFQPRPVAHAPSPFGFGFALSSTPSMSMSPTKWGGGTPGHTNPSAFQQLASSMAQSATLSRPSKRRLEIDDDVENSRLLVGNDDAMDRSPTPERPKRAAPKRARTTNPPDATGKDATRSKENKVPNGEDDVDVGVLLASLPTQSLLPLLSSLVKAKPELKAAILTLIPRPTLETAIQALAVSAKKLRDAYPYHNSTSSSSSIFSSSRGESPFSQTTMATFSNSSGMRDSYIISRLRPHVTEFVSCCMSYLPYFTCIPSTYTGPSSPSSSQSATTIRSLHKDKFHPSETFLFLSAMTNQILSQPPLTINEITTSMLSKIQEEWRSWVEKIDEVIKQGGMFGSETVQSWERGLDEMANTKPSQLAVVMRGVRDGWISKVGWLVGRTTQQAMDDEI